ncbi:MAG: ATP-binding cassette domain-containing protein [Actinobacteria bacterium]|nr:ATP-binding cassette domain-containing protein [Actinomycetota bacterium]
MPASISEIHLLDVCHRYNEKPVVSNFSVTVPEGHSLALLGPSGCGKTTLLRLIAGLAKPYSGAIKLGENVVASDDSWVAPEDRNVGLVFQDWALFPHLTVAKNVAFGLQRSASHKNQVQDMLDLVGLTGYGHRLPSTLSGGQQQRVALARALAPQPKVLLLDEPFSNLDSGLRNQVRSEVAELLSELRITSVFVTHDQEEAFALGDHVGVMNSGTLEQIGKPEEIYMRPANPWVANIAGEASFIEGMAHGQSAETAIGRIELTAEHQGPVKILLRPEQLAIDQREGTEGSRVERVEYRGSDYRIFLRLDATILEVSIKEPFSLQRGDYVNVSFTGRPAVAYSETTSNGI